MRNKTLRPVSFLLVLLLLFGGAPVAANAASVGNETALRNAVANGGLHKLTKNISLSATLVIPQGKTVTLDLNGKTLDRGLTEYQSGGSVIEVSPDATLNLIDTSMDKGGAITGGFSTYGGGIFNFGTLTLNHGVRVIGNSAARPGYDGCGGGIYNDRYSTLILHGGQISDNTADLGGGIFNHDGGTLIIETESYEDTVDGIQQMVTSNVTVTGNRADKGAGIYSDGGRFSLSGAPVLSGNDKNDDICLTKNGKISCGALDFKTPVGVTFSENDTLTEFVFTENYSANNPGKTGDLFFSPKDAVRMFQTAAENSELRLVKTGKTVVEAYEKGKLVFIGEYDTPQKAWDASGSYRKKNDYYFNDATMRRYAADRARVFNPNYKTDPSQFNDWMYRYSGPGWYGTNVENKKEFFEDCDWITPQVQAEYWYWDGYLKDDYKVKITLGSDWSFTTRQIVDRFCDITLDLNGHTVMQNRGGKKTETGYLFCVDPFARFTVLDSNPTSDGYTNGGKTIRGGVITGGRGKDNPGCFKLYDYAELNVFGGTIYDCMTDYHGGGIYTGEGRRCAKINLKNCTFDNCQTKGSGDDCNGGAVYVKDTLSVNMENVTFRSCMSEDNGGALYITNRPGVVKLKNCAFTNCYADDYGGAIHIKSVADNKMFLFEAVGCTFTGNACAEDGGAVCVSDNDDSVLHYPTIFRDCTFTKNTSRGDGSAFEIDDDSVSLISCTITDNKAYGRAAVYVNDRCRLSVGGKTVIKGNNGLNQLLLDNDGDKTRVYSTGLKEGSEIVINCIGGNNTILMKDIPERELRYFKPIEAANHGLTFRKTGEKDANLVLASVFGSGTVWSVIGIAGAAAIAAAVIVIVRKKKNGRQTEENA